MESETATPPTSPLPTGAPLRPTKALGDGWNTFKGNAGLTIGVLFVACVIHLAGSLIPFLNVLYIVLVAPALGGGVAGFLLRCARGEKPAFDSLFDGFKRWASVTGAVLIQMAVTMLFVLPMIIVMMITAGAAGFTNYAQGRSFDAGPFFAVPVILAMVVTYPFLIWWSARSAFVIFAVMEPGAPGAMESFKQAWALTRGSAWRLVGLALLGIPLALLGLLALVIGYFVALFVILFGWAHAYDQLRARAGLRPAA